jgi:hypothetical protein
MAGGLLYYIFFSWITNNHLGQLWFFLYMYILLYIGERKNYSILWLKACAVCFHAFLPVFCLNTEFAAICGLIISIINLVHLVV